MTTYYGDPDLIWISDAAKEYGRSRTTMDSLISQGIIHAVQFAGDRRVFLRRSELDVKLNKPLQDVPGQDQAG